MDLYGDPVVVSNSELFLLARWIQESLSHSCLYYMLTGLLLCLWTLPLGKPYAFPVVSPGLHTDTGNRSSGTTAFISFPRAKARFHLPMIHGPTLHCVWYMGVK